MMNEAKIRITVRSSLGPSCGCILFGSMYIVVQLGPKIFHIASDISNSYQYGALSIGRERDLFVT